MLVGGLIITAGALFWLDRHPDEEAQTQESVDQLYLRVTPRPAERGDPVRFFVQGEPPINLKARTFADLLSEDGELLFRLDSVPPHGDPPAPIPYPLSENYVPPTETTRLQARQVVSLPARLRPGRYTLQAYIFGRDRYTGGTPHRGTPSWTFPILAR